MRNEGPFSVEEIEALSTEISPETKRPYGVQRVCLAWDQARSSFYVRKQRRDEPDAEPPQKPGPKTALSDEALLVKIQEDLAASPFKGEGHRKVWARLRVIQPGLFTETDFANLWVGPAGAATLSIMQMPSIPVEPSARPSVDGQRPSRARAWRRAAAPPIGAVLGGVREWAVVRSVLAAASARPTDPGGDDWRPDAV